MSCTKFTVYALALFALLQIDNASGATAKTKGCLWGGCSFFREGCLTPNTGGSGRYKWMETWNCGYWYGKQEYCCDENCFHRECGIPCNRLDLDGSYDGTEGSTKPKDCKVTVNLPGYGNIQRSSQQHFCCG